MSVSCVAASGITGNNTSASMTLSGITSGITQVDDIILAPILLRGNQVVSSTSGMSLLIAVNNTANQRLEIWWKRVTVANDRIFQFTKPIDDDLTWAGVSSVWRGVKNTGSPFDATAPSVSANASSDTVTYAAFDPATTCHVVAVGCYNNDLTTAGAIGGTDPTLVNVWDLETSSGDDGSLFAFSGDSSGASTGARSHSTTSAADDISIGVLFGLVPLQSTGSVAGTSTAAAVGQGIAQASGSVAGTSTASAVARSTSEAAGAAAGTSTAAAVGQGIAQASGSVAGASTAAATGQAVVQAIGSAAGTSTASAVGESIETALGAELPAVRTRLDERARRRPRPILSGQLDVDANVGSRGISRELNHAHAYRTRLISEHWPSDDEPEMSQGAPLSVVAYTAILTKPWRRAPNVRAFVLTAWVAGGTWRIGGSYGNSTGSLIGTTPTEITETLALAADDDYGAATDYLTVEVMRTGSQEAKLYAWELVELEETAPQVP